MLVGEPDEPVLLLPAGVCHPLETYQMELEDPKKVKKDEDDDGDRVRSDVFENIALL